MEGFYVVFDRVQKRLGFALSTCAGTNTVTHGSTTHTHQVRLDKLTLHSLHSERGSGPVRNSGALLGSRRGVRLFQQPPEGTVPVDRVLRSDGRLRLGPHHPAAAAHPALPTQGQLRGDHGRVLAGPTPHPMTDGAWSGTWDEGAGTQHAEHVHARGEGHEDTLCTSD